MRCVDLTEAGLALACLTAAAWAQAGDPRWQFTTGVDSSSGKYGGSDTTEIRYVPFTLRYNAEPWQFKLTVPYVTIRSTGGTIIGYDDNGVPIRSGGGARSTESGLGDVVASSRALTWARAALTSDLPT